MREPRSSTGNLRRNAGRRGGVRGTAGGVAHRSGTGTGLFSFAGEGEVRSPAIGKRTRAFARGSGRGRPPLHNLLVLLVAVMRLVVGFFSGFLQPL